MARITTNPAAQGTYYRLPSTDYNDYIDYMDLGFKAQPLLLFYFQQERYYNKASLSSFFLWDQISKSKINTPFFKPWDRTKMQ